MQNKRRYLLMAWFCFWGFLFLTKPVHAYIDPSVMTYAIQAISGIAIALGAFLGIYWRKLKRKLGWTSKKKMESDELVFHDPDTGRDIYALKERKIEKAEVKKEKKNRFRELSAGILLSLAAAILIGIHAPLVLYFTNASEFWFDFEVLLPEAVLLALAVFLINIVVLFIAYALYDHFYYVLVLFETVLLIYFFIQGNFLTGNMPAMDGRSVDWSAYTKDNIISAVLFAGILIFFVLLTRFGHIKNALRAVKGCSILSIVFSMVLVIITGAANQSTYKKVEFSVTTRNLNTMSEDENFVIFLVDAVDSATFNRLLNGPDESWNSDFSDFTYYPDAMGKYPFTAESVPYILSGRLIDGENVNYGEFATDSMKESPLFQKLRDENYVMGMYDSDITFNDDQVTEFDNIDISNGFSSFTDFARNSLKYTLFQYLPYWLKGYVGVQWAKFEPAVTSDDSAFDWNNTTFKNYMNQTPIEKTKEKRFEFIHLEGAHVPYHYDREANMIDPGQGTYDQNVEASAYVAGQYIQAMKDAGTYDNSVIVIMSDHGYNPNQEGDEGTFGRENPLLMIKGRNEHHELRIDEAPVEYGDLQEAYERLLDGKPSSECFDASAGEKRDRYYYFYYYLQEDHIMEYVQHGKANERDSEETTGRTFGFKK